MSRFTPSDRAMPGLMSKLPTSSAVFFCADRTARSLTANPDYSLKFISISNSGLDAEIPTPMHRLANRQYSGTEGWISEEFSFILRSLMSSAMVLGSRVALFRCLPEVLNRQPQINFDSR
jgi:hypothetical protein